MTDLTLKVERTIASSPADVFQAWLNPSMLQKFMCPATGVTVPKAATDPKVGGRFEILMQMGDEDIPHAGTYKEIDPHDRLVFTWESPYSTEDSTVTLIFAPKDGGTHVSLTHVRFPSQESRDNHDKGWTKILETLDHVLG